MEANWQKSPTLSGARTPSLMSNAACSRCSMGLQGIFVVGRHRNCAASGFDGEAVLWEGPTLGAVTNPLRVSHAPFLSRPSCLQVSVHSPVKMLAKTNAPRTVRQAAANR